MTEKKYILFDLDGTIVDSGEGIKEAVKYSLKKIGIEETNEKVLNSFIGPPLLDSYMINYNLEKEEATKLVELYRENYKKSGLFKNKLYPEIETVIEKLKKDGNKIILATSKPKIFAEEVLKQNNLTKYFDFIGGATLDGNISSKTEVINDILCNFDIDTNKTYMIGDTKYDIVGGRRFNLKTVGVTYGYGKEEELKKEKADFIVNCPIEILKVMQKQ